MSEARDPYATDLQEGDWYVAPVGIHKGHRIFVGSVRPGDLETSMRLTCADCKESWRAERSLPSHLQPSILKSLTPKQVKRILKHYRAINKIMKEGSE